MSDQAAWEQAWERDKEMVGRAAHEAWLAWIAAASPLGHIPKRQPDGDWKIEERSTPEDLIATGWGWNPTYTHRGCVICNETPTSHMPDRGPQRVAFEDPFCATWDDLEPEQRDTIINAVGGRERFRLGYLAAARENERLREAARRFLACTKTSECQFDDDGSGETCYPGCKADGDLESLVTLAADPTPGADQ